MELVSDNQGNVSFTAALTEPGLVTYPTLVCSTTAGLAASYPIELESAAGVPALRAFTPQGTLRPPLPNPELAMTDDELRAGGYPPRPDATTAPAAYKQWLDFVSAPGTIINEEVGLAPPLHTRSTTEVASNWAGFQTSFKTGSPPLLEGYGQWPVPDISFPQQTTNQDFVADYWAGRRRKWRHDVASWHTNNPLDRAE
jgi:hypothetical protein